MSNATQDLARYQKPASMPNMKRYTGWAPDTQPIEANLLALKTDDPKLGTVVATWFNQKGEYIGWSSVNYARQFIKRLPENAPEYYGGRARWHGWFVSRKVAPPMVSEGNDKNVLYVLETYIDEKELIRGISQEVTAALADLESTSKRQHGFASVGSMDTISKQTLGNAFMGSYTEAKAEFERTWLAKAKEMLEGM